MKTRVIVLLLIAVLIMATTASAAAQGTPWPAIVIKDPSSGWCDAAWLNTDGIFVLVPVTHQTIVLSGQDRVLVKNCHAFVDFSDPQYMPWEEACTIFPCHGDVLTVNFTWDWYDEYGEPFASSQPGRLTAHKSGEIMMTYTTVWR